MALSKQTEESLRDAESCLRNALVSAARNEKPYIAKHISDMIVTIESIINIDSCLLYTSPSPRDQRGSRMPSSA